MKTVLLTHKKSAILDILDLQLVEFSRISSCLIIISDRTSSETTMSHLQSQLYFAVVCFKVK